MRYGIDPNIVVLSVDSHIKPCQLLRPVQRSCEKRAQQHGTSELTLIRPSFGGHKALPVVAAIY